MAMTPAAANLYGVKPEDHAMLIKTAEPSRYVERMLAARDQRRRRRRPAAVLPDIAVAAVESQPLDLQVMTAQRIASWSGPIPVANLRRVRAGLAPTRNAV